MLDAAVAVEIDGDARRAEPCQIGGRPHRQKPYRTTEWNRDHVLRHRFSEANTRVKARCHNVDQTAIGDEVESDVGKAVEKGWHDCTRSGPGG